VGAGAADAAIKFDSEWESHNPAATRAERVERYYKTRLPIEELTGDIDAWGIDEARNSPGAPTTIEGLLADYYTATPVPDAGAGATGGASGTHTSKRRSGVERFLRHYGLRFGSGVPHLKAQTKPRDDMKKQIIKFGTNWLEFRPGEVTLAVTTAMTSLADDMVDRLLDDIEQLAGQVGASV
jgi:hypothetical protein